MWFVFNVAVPVPFRQLLFLKISAVRPTLFTFQMYHYLLNLPYIVIDTLEKTQNLLTFDVVLVGSWKRIKASFVFLLEMSASEYRYNYKTSMVCP